MGVFDDEDVKHILKMIEPTVFSSEAEGLAEEGGERKGEDGQRLAIKEEGEEVKEEEEGAGEDTEDEGMGEDDEELELEEEEEEEEAGKEEKEAGDVKKAEGKREAEEKEAKAAEAEGDRDNVSNRRFFLRAAILSSLMAPGPGLSLLDAAWEQQHSPTQAEPSSLGSNPWLHLLLARHL